MKILLNKAHAFIARRKDAGINRGSIFSFGWLFAFAFAFLVSGGALVAQQMIWPLGTSVIGMLGTQGKAPVLTGGTLVAGSTDAVGSFTASAASGTLVFAVPLSNAPFCQLTDASATPIAVYAVTTTQITLTTMTSAHVYYYDCNSR